MSIFGFGNSGSSKRVRKSENDDLPPVPRVKKELKLPELKGEAWVKKWAAGEVKTTVEKSSELISKLVDSDDAEEKFLANYNLALLGDQERIPTLFELAKANSDLQTQLFPLLEWFPFEQRSNLYRKFLPFAYSESRMNLLMSKLVSVRNPRSAELIWESADNASLTSTAAYENLLKVYFADSGSTYNSISDYGVDKNLIKHAVEQTNKHIDSTGPKKQMAALLFLNNLDPKAGKKAAIRLAEKAETLNVKDLAFRMSLKRDSNGDNFDYSKKPDLSHAVQYLDTKEAWKYKIALRYMAVGPESLNSSDNMPETIYLASRVYYYGGNNNKVKVKIPKPPKGMTLEHLKRDDLKFDDETNALVTYYRVLLDNKTDIEPLLKFYSENMSNEGIAKLVYEAVATTNNDIKIPIVEAIYDDHGEYDESFAANLYWTIRVMDGENAIKLRKKIRDNVGMESLNNY